MTHICTSSCGKDYDCPVCEHGYNEFDDSRVCPDCSLSPREKSIAEIAIIQNWYLKRYISFNEFLRLTDLIF